jgi:hypothetical protein
MNQHLKFIQIPSKKKIELSIFQEKEKILLDVAAGFGA